MAHLTFDDGFYHADRARDVALGNSAGVGNNVLTEINALQVAVDEAARKELLVMDSDDEGLTGSTVMTGSPTSPSDSVYNKVWTDYQGALRDAATPADESEVMRAKIEMDRVIAYFSRRGYVVTRDESSSVSGAIKWIIKW